MVPDDASPEPVTSPEPASSPAAWSPPPYAEPWGFVEQDVTVGAGALAVPGTLTLPKELILPKNRGVGTGVVLLSGGGPFDRDESSGPNKPLKDVAWGLAGKGITVLRFDKPTFAHREVLASPDLTMTKEYVPYAVDAVRMLQRHPAVDAERVFVVGHSMGGKVAPSVAAADPSVAGLVIMAGDTQPMHHAAVRVVSYLASVLPDQVPQTVVDTFTRQAAFVDGSELTVDTPAADLPFGLPPSYWLELRDYDPAAIAATLDKPMLILQGGRDYQVTVADDLGRWRGMLGDRPEVDIRVYEADNHLFSPGTGRSTPADYDVPHHVDPAVIADIAEWLGRTPPATASGGSSAETAP